jgi:beta-fructofuranosidase
LDGRTFDHDGGAVLDCGGCLYAPLSFLDAAGRRLLIGWVREGRSVEDAEPGGWNGCLSLPRELTLGADGRLRQTPVAELEALREGAFRDDAAPRGRLLEIEVTFDRDAAGGDPCGLDVLASADPGSGLPIRFEPESGAITAGEFTLGTLAADEREARLRVFVDQSVIEVFANERIAGAVRHYSGSAAEDRVHLVGEPTARRAWPLRPIWPLA